MNQRTMLLAGALAAGLTALSAQAGTGIAHRYNFTANANDVVGTANGVLWNGASVTGGALSLSSVDGNGNNIPSSNTNGQYMTLPGTLFSGLTNTTIEFWGSYGYAGISAGTWSRVFDFGTSINGSGENYIFYTPHSGNPDSRSGFRINGSEVNAVDANVIDDGNPHHVACVYDCTNKFMELYVDGVKMGRNPCSFQLSSLATNNMYIGRSQWGGDQFLFGTIDEFRVYNRAISGVEVAADFAAGPDVPTPAMSVLGNLGAINLTDPGVLTEKATTNTMVTADFDNATGVQMFNLPGFSLTSSDPTIVSVSPVGAIVAVKPGTANIIASYGGKTSTLAITVIADPVPPAVASVNPAGYDRYLQVVFSKPVDPVTAQVAANYVIDAGTPAVTKAILNTNDNKTVTLIFASKVDAASFHTLVISNVKDTDFNANTIAANSTKFFPAAGSPLVERIYFQTAGYNTDLMANKSDGTLGGFNIFNNPDYPHTGGTLLSMNNGLMDPGPHGDNYVTVIDGYILPPASGSYNFFIASDDQSALYVSSDDTEANLPTGTSYTASQNGWVGQRSYSGGNGAGGGYNTTKTPITLNAGNKYYFRYVWHNGGGGNFFDVAWQLPGGSIPADGSAAIGSAFLADPAYSPVPLTITGVASQTTYQNQDVTFAATVTSKPTYTGLQWYRDGVAISNATSLSYTMVLPKGADNGAKFYLVASNLVDVVTSAVATVTVIVDNVTPTLVSAAGSSGNQVILTFSERLDATSATKAANYTIPGVTVTRADFLDASKTVVVLTTSTEVGGNTYTVTVNGVKDLAGNAMSNAAINYIAPGRLDGYTFLNWWHFDQALYNNDTATDNIYPFSRTNTAGGNWLVTSCIGTPHALTTWTEGMDSYCDVAEGYLLAPETGSYVIHITSDDRSRVYLSTNETVTGLSTNPIASVVNGWTDNNLNWNNGNARWSATNLVAGQRYFYRVVHENGTGGNGYVVGWETPSAPGTIIYIPPTNFGTYYDPNKSIINITNQPSSVSAQATGVATFMVVAGGSSSFGANVTYQWMSNGVAIVGATMPFYTTPQLTTAANGAVFTCVLTVAGKTVTTTPVTLTVADTAPAIVSAGAFANSTSVGIRFNKLVNPASAVSATYTIPGNTVSSVQFRTNASLDAVNGDTVVLTVANAITAATTVTVSGVSDLNGHTTSSSSGAVSIVSDMLTSDIGTPGVDPLFVGVSVPTGANSYQILAGGTDIWDTHDGAQFVYKLVTGDFDIRCRVADLQNDSTWSKAGLMVRETLDTGSRDLSVVVDPTTGANAWESNYRDVTGGSSSGWPAQHANDLAPTYPHAWVRLTGIGSVYTSYRSWDGVNWVQLAQLNYSKLPYANQYVGICVTAHNNDGTSDTIADIYDFALTSLVTTPPSLTATLVGGNTVISWDSTLGAGYSLVSASSLTAPSWTPVTTPTVISGTKTTVTVPSSGSLQFYRLMK